MSGRDWFLLWLLSLCWGASFFFVEIALTGFAPFALTFGRIGIAAVMLGALLAAHGVSLRAVLGRWRVYAPVGFFGNALPFTAFAWGQQYIDSGLAGVLNATTPIFTLILAAIIGEERATAPRVGGILLGFVGVCVLLSPAVGDPGERFLLGALAPITAGCAYGVAVLWARRRAGGFAPAEKCFRAIDFRDHDVVAAGRDRIGAKRICVHERAGRGVGGGFRHRVFQHLLRVFDLLPLARFGGSGQHDIGDFYHPDKRRRARRVCFGGSFRSRLFRWRGLDSCEFAGYRSAFARRDLGAVGRTARLDFTPINGSNKGAPRKGGGERGIRTLDADFSTYALSRRAPSTARPSLREYRSGGF